MGRRKRHPTARVVMGGADAHEAFRNIGIHPDHAQYVAYTFGEFIVVVDLRLTFGWTNSLGYWGVISNAAKFLHCNTNKHNVEVVEEGRRVMEHITIRERWEKINSTPVPSDVGDRTASTGGIDDTFSTRHT